MAEISVLIQMNSPPYRCGGVAAAVLEVEAGRMTETLGDARLCFRSRYKVSKLS